MNGAGTDDRRNRFLNKASDKSAQETALVLERLRGRPDRKRGYDYFLNLAETGLTSAKTAERTGRPVVNLMCLQAPLELIYAAGFSPFKVFSGSLADGSLASQGFPALMCPLLRSVLGAVQQRRYESNSAWVLPTTCDWMIKFPEMLKLNEERVETPVHWLELPHLKDGPEGQERWLGEIYRLKRFLEALAQRKIGRRQLKEAVTIYHEAWLILNTLARLRRAGAMPAVWFFLITGVFFMDGPENWTAAVRALLPELMDEPSAPQKVFLAGSPIFFPNFKLLWLLEEAGLEVTVDDMCSGQRLLPGGVSYSDHSEFGLMSALAQRYHQGCLCPTFIDNDRRLNNILNPATQGGYQGVVFQVLKGCHPFDLESFIIEPGLKTHGLKFIRLETDYAAEDSQNLLTRLEAFAQTLKGN